MAENLKEEENTTVTKKRSCDQNSTPNLHVLYPPGEPCYVKVVEKEETFYIPAVLSNNLDRHTRFNYTTRVFYMTPSAEIEEHEVLIGRDIGTGDTENIRDMLYNEYKNNLKDYEYSDSDDERAYEDAGIKQYTSSVPTCSGFDKKDGVWVPNGEIKRIIDTERFVMGVDICAISKKEYYYEDIEYRDRIAIKLLPSSYARKRYHSVTRRLIRDKRDEEVIMKEIINGIAYKYTGVEVDAKNVIIGDEAIRRLNSVTHECEWVSVMWLGPFYGIDEFNALPDTHPVKDIVENVNDRDWYKSYKISRVRLDMYVAVKVDGKATRAAPRRYMPDVYMLYSDIDNKPINGTKGRSIDDVKNLMKRYPSRWYSSKKRKNEETQTEASKKKKELK